MRTLSALFVVAVMCCGCPSKTITPPVENPADPWPVQPWSEDANSTAN